jgi:hypothetical protein
MAHFIAINIRDYEGRATGDVETYILDTDQDVTDAREALKAYGLESAAVLSGDPDECDHVDTGLRLWA